MHRLAAAVLLLSLAVLPVSPTAAAEDGRPLLVTVDDLPLNRRQHPDPVDRLAITRALLAKLQSRNIRAVGFVTWGNIAGPEDVALLKLWLDAGHELGNHSTLHLDLNSTDIETYGADIEEGRRRLAELLEPRGETVRFFRFPMLHEGDTPEKRNAMREYLAATGQRNLQVTFDNPDWSFERAWVDARQQADRPATGRVREDYLAAMRAAIAYHERVGDTLFGREVPQILLLHAGEVGAVLWAPLFDWLVARGYRFADADEVLADPAFEQPDDYVGPAGYGRWDRLARDRERTAAVSEVQALLDRQVEAWNAGDLEEFCAVYAEDAAFISTTGLHRGRGEVLARYRKRYPDRAAMGRLSFDVVEARPAQGQEISMLGDARPGRVHAVTLVARWRLDRAEAESSSGLTMLVVRRTRDGWEIVQDASM